MNKVDYNIQSDLNNIQAKCLNLAQLINYLNNLKGRKKIMEQAKELSKTLGTFNQKHN